MNEIKPLTPFRFWAQKVIPLVYDESLSYYELLCKVIEYLNTTGIDFNELLENFNEFSEDMTGKFDDLSGEFDDLKEWTEHEFPEFVNDKLDEMAEDGTLTALIAPYLPFVTPEMFGCKGDGVTDDTVNFQIAADSCRDNNTLLYCPKSSKYLLSSQVILDRVKGVEAYGNIIAQNKLVIKGVSSQAGDYNILLQKVTGTVLVEGIKNGMFKIVEASELELYADSEQTGLGSIAYNTFYLGAVNSINIHSNASGWINENAFYGGRLQTLTIGDSENVGTYPHNNNHFYNPCLEDGTINFYCAASNYIHNGRFEGTCHYNFYARARSNFVDRAWLGEHLPTISTPSTWNDISGKNFYCRGPESYYKTKEVIYTVESKNYDCEKLYPLNGKLHNTSYNNKFFETDFIDITHGVGFSFASDATFIRAYIYIYDENKDPIIDQPAYSPIIGDSYVFNHNESQGWYSVSTANINHENLTIAKMSPSTPFLDTGVKYIKIQLRGYGSANLEYFKAFLTAPYYSFLSFVSKSGLRSETMPANGEWTDGDYCVNTGNASCAGWVYNNSAWHAVGEWT